MTDTFEAGDKVPKILIADDDPAIVRLLAERCVDMGFEVFTAANGIQALLMARQNEPDILIIDVNMPEVGGFSVCERLLDPGRKPLEVVVITGSSSPETIERCGSFGTFYGRKGPDFWNGIATALATLCPGMADKIGRLDTRRTGTEMRKRPRVLLIDDDPDIERFFSSRLRKCGMEVLYAPDAIHGYRIACKEEPSVIITDNFMPDGDALYLLSRLRTTAVTENIPVFVMSGGQLDAMTEQILKREICGRPGALRVFRKSFDTQELFQALQQFCGFERVGAEA